MSRPRDTPRPTQFARLCRLAQRGRQTLTGLVVHSHLFRRQEDSGRPLVQGQQLSKQGLISRPSRGDVCTRRAARTSRPTPNQAQEGRQMQGGPARENRTLCPVPRCPDDGRETAGSLRLTHRRASAARKRSESTCIRVVEALERKATIRKGLPVVRTEGRRPYLEMKSIGAAPPEQRVVLLAWAGDPELGRQVVRTLVVGLEVKKA